MVPRVCFDTNAWISILNQESHIDLDSLMLWAGKVQDGKATLLVPAIVSTEVGAGPDEASIRQFENALKQPYVEQIDITHSIGLRAGKLRRQVLDHGWKLKTPDAMVVIAAETFRANFILSTDKDVIRLDGNFGLRAKIGPPSTGLDLPLFDQA